MTNRGKKLVKMLERLIKQDHLYSQDEIRELKKQLRIVKEQLNELDAMEKRGFK
jgi:hypothetical protein|tara:strand:- start:3529 stop:3690 length:162 start_codon:yes stop_codon:yes gene_type:complete